MSQNGFIWLIRIVRRRFSPGSRFVISIAEGAGINGDRPRLESTPKMWSVPVDPLTPSFNPIPKGDWEQHIKNINPGGVSISDKLKGLK